jgi:hypothetical protein
MSKIRIPEKEGLIIKLIEKYGKEKFSIDLQSDKPPFLDYYSLNTKIITNDIERMSYMGVDFITFMTQLNRKDAGIPYISYKISPSGEVSLNGILTAPSTTCDDREGLLLRYEAITIRNPSKEYLDFSITYKGLTNWRNELEPRFRFRISNSSRSLGFSCLDGEPPNEKMVIRGFSYVFRYHLEKIPSKPSESVFLDKKFLEQGYQYKIIKLSDFLNLNKTKFLNWDSNPFQKN